MNAIRSRIAAVVIGTLWTIAAGAPALADDTEIYVNLESASGAQPNVLFIIDTSGSMTTNVTVDKGPYDPNVSYEGPCRDGRIYYRSGTGAPPTCGSSNYIEAKYMHCKAAADALSGLAGSWTGKAAQFNSNENKWKTISATNRDVECEADGGKHGSNSAPTPNTWARNDKNKWTSVAGQAISWSSQTTYTFYSENWLNWYNGGKSTVQMSRLQIVQQVATSLASSIDKVNLGLMRFSSNTTGGGDASAEGGMVTHEVADIATARATIIDRLNSYTASGNTPLSETLYEAYLYLTGGKVDYGVNSRINPTTPFPSVAGSRRPDNPAYYKSPIEYKCQKNVVILLTDGEPTQDNSADAKITSLPGYVEATGDVNRNCGETGAGRCLDEMAAYLYNSDLAPSLEGKQNAIVYAIGFGTEAAGSPRLDRVAAAGGTKRAYAAQDITELTVALQDIFRDLIDRNTTFVTPSVSVNAFNRAQTLDDLYVSVFKPTDTLAWPGNLKKYRLVGNEIVDADGNDAVGEDGFFAQGTRSIWSATPDDHFVDKGGAMSRLPAAGTRKLYTHLESAGTANLTAPANALSVSNSRLTDELLRTGGTNPSREEVINWAQGYDTRDEDGDGIKDEQGRRFMGDPLHGKPAVVTYGQVGRDPDQPERDVVVFLPTNDGFLHAIGGWSDTATGGGRELWAFIPEELLPRLVDVYQNPTTLERTYGLDGDIRVLKFDLDMDGIVEPSDGDKVYLFFGMRRGGRYYYALDVTNRDEPKLLWKIGPNQLPGVGETWSPPTVARVNVPGKAQNSEYFVLIFGGGYDDAQENYAYTTDTVGNRIYMVDAFSGNLLWYAGGPGSTGTPDLQLPNMTNSITGRITVIDINGDGFADRMYAADLGGRIWRFDIFNGRTSGPFVTGGVLARLGAGDNPGATIADTRRFYHGTDVSLVQRRGADPYYNIAIGSGYRGHPLHKDTNDYFFSVRDKMPFRKLSQSEYAALEPITIDDLVDLPLDGSDSVVVPADAKGWKLLMAADGPLTGEKVLAESTTVDNVIMFPSYQPAPPDDDLADPCHPQAKNRVYAVRVDDGRPAFETLYEDLAQKDGIVGEITVGLIRRGRGKGDDETPCEGPSCQEENPGEDEDNVTVCLAGVEILSRCVSPGGVVRTFWQKNVD